MRNTALSAAHMVRNPVSPGGDDMVKVRLQGTKEDIEFLVQRYPRELTITEWGFALFILFGTNSPMQNILTWCMIEKLKHRFNDKS